MEHLGFVRRRTTAWVGVALSTVVALCALTVPDAALAAVDGDADTQISGTVTATGPAPVDRVAVTAYRFLSGDWWEFGTVETDDLGDYLIDVPAGTYRLRFHDRAGYYADEFWDGGTRLVEATDIAAAAGEPTSGVSPELEVGAHITGTLTNLKGQPIYLAGVSALRLIDGQWVSSYRGSTMSDGGYDLTGLVAGTYRLWFYDARFNDEFWDDAPDVHSASDVVVSTGQTISGKNGDLAPAGSKVVSQVAPSVSGAAVVGGTLTANTGTWTPSPTSFTYKWKANGALIEGATGPTFTPGPSQAGRSISVQVHAYKTGYETGWNDSAAVPIPPAVARTLENTAAPTITGAARVGSTLTASPGSWNATGVEYSYRWSIGTTVVPTTTAHLEVPPTALGSSITVTVTAAMSGMTSGTATSAATAAVQPGSIRIVSTPTIRGAARVGKKLTVSAGQTAPTGIKVTFQWVRGGTVVKESSAAGYRITRADLGRRLWVRATYSLPGYTDRVVKTSRTDRVRARSVQR
jgi:hypothetical protein